MGPMNQETVSNLQNIVLAADGEWVGLQESLSNDMVPLVLFNSAKTGSTLALPADENFTVATVREHIRISDEQFEKSYVRVPRWKLRSLLAMLTELQIEIKGYLGDK
jgi:hypothetical protein